MKATKARKLSRKNSIKILTKDALCCINKACESGFYRTQIILLTMNDYDSYAINFGLKSNLSKLGYLLGSVEVSDKERLNVRWIKEELIKEDFKNE